MNQELNQKTYPKPPYCRLSLLALVLFCLSALSFFIGIWVEVFDFENKLTPNIFICFLALCVISLPISTLISIVAIWKTTKSKSPIRGKDMSTLTFILSIIAGLILFTMPAQGKIKPIAQRVVCGTNLKGLGTALVVYANDFDDKYPVENWCDLLIQHADISPENLICSSSDLEYGECSYAMNQYILNIPTDQLSEDTILLFEANNKGDLEREGLVKNREAFSEYPIYKDFYFSGEEVVKIDCWNQIGGPELLTTKNHAYQGCNVLFADGHSEWVKYEKISSLKWDPKDPTVKWTPEQISPEDHKNVFIIPLSACISVIIIISGLCLRRKWSLVFFLTSASVFAFLGALSGHILLHSIMMTSKTTGEGLLLGSLWGTSSGFLFALWFVKKPSHRPLYPLMGTLIGILGAFLTNISLLIYTKEYEFFTIGTAIYGGIAMGAFAAWVLNFPARWVFRNEYPFTIKPPKPPETLL